MLKTTWLERFREGDRDELARRWEQEGGAAAREIPGLLRYVQNRTVTNATLAGAADGESPFDGFSAMWFADEAALEAALRSPEWERFDAVRRELLDVDWTEAGRAVAIEERVQRVGLGSTDDGVSTPPQTPDAVEPIKLIGLLQYRRDMTRDEANAYWAGRHTEIALTITHIGHYTQNHALRTLNGEPFAFDGYSESWYADMATYEAAMASAPWRALGADGDNLFDMSIFESAIVVEHVVKQFEPAVARG